MSALWDPEMVVRVYERLSVLGFHSLSEFIDSRPMRSLVSVARELRTGVAAIELEVMWFREAERRGRIEQLLGSLLIREIRDAIPDGWSSGDQFISNLAGGYASWCSVANQVLPQAERLTVWEVMRGLSPPPGWLPVFPHDAWTAQLQVAIDEALARAETPSSQQP